MANPAHPGRPLGFDRLAEIPIGPPGKSLDEWAELPFDIDLLEQLRKATGIPKKKLVDILKDIQKAAAAESTDWGEGKVKLNLLDPVGSLEAIPASFIDSFIAWGKIDKTAKAAVWDTLFTNDESKLQLLKEDPVTGRVVASSAGPVVPGQGWGALPLAAADTNVWELDEMYGSMVGQVKNWLADKKEGKEDYGKFQDSWLGILDKICEKYEVKPIDAKSGAIINISAHLTALEAIREEVKTAETAKRNMDRSGNLLAFRTSLSIEDEIEKKKKDLGEARTKAWEDTDNLANFYSHLPATAREEFDRAKTLRLIVKNRHDQNVLEEKLAIFGVLGSVYKDGINLGTLQATWKWMGAIAPKSIGAFQKTLKESSAFLAKSTRWIGKLIKLPQEVTKRAFGAVKHFGLSASVFTNHAFLHGTAAEAVKKVGYGVGRLGKVGLSEFTDMMGGPGKEILGLQQLYNYSNGLGAAPAALGAITHQEARALSEQLGSAFLGKTDWGSVKGNFKKAKGTLLTGTKLTDAAKKLKSKISLLDRVAKIRKRLGVLGDAVVAKGRDLIVKAAAKFGLKKAATWAMAAILAPETAGLSVAVERLFTWVIIPLLKKFFGWIWNKLVKGVWDKTVGAVIDKVKKVVPKEAWAAMGASFMAVVVAPIAAPLALLAGIGCVFMGVVLGMVALVFMVIIGASSDLSNPLGMGGGDYFSYSPPPAQEGYIPPITGDFVVVVTPNPSRFEGDSGVVSYTITVTNNTDTLVTVDLKDEALLVTSPQLVIDAGSSGSFSWGGNLPSTYQSSCPELGRNVFCNRVVASDSVTQAALGWGMGQVLFNSAAGDWPSGWPVGPAGHCISQGPGGSFTHSRLEAVDLTGPLNSTVTATHDGVVTRALYSNGGYGNYVVVCNSSQTAEYCSYYAHLSAIFVEEGANIAKGTTIGAEGNSGSISTGTHLHYEFRGPIVFMGPPYFPVSVPACSGVSNCAAMMVKSCW